MIHGEVSNTRDEEDGRRWRNFEEFFQGLEHLSFEDLSWGTINGAGFYGAVARVHEGSQLSYV